MPGSTTPQVITLCGSTKFKDEFLEAQRSLTLEGNIVISVGMFGHADGLEIQPDTKAMLDELHKRKIDISDAIYVVNVGGYIGESTRGEIDYAYKHRKRVLWLENSRAPETFRDAVRIVANSMTASGFTAGEVLVGIRTRWPGCWSLCTVIDVADELTAIYGR